MSWLLFYPLAELFIAWQLLLVLHFLEYISTRGFHVLFAFQGVMFFVSVILHLARAEGIASDTYHHVTRQNHPAVERWRNTGDNRVVRLDPTAEYHPPPPYVPRLGRRPGRTPPPPYRRRRSGPSRSRPRLHRRPRDPSPHRHDQE